LTQRNSRRTGMGARGGSTGSPEASAAAARPPTHHRSRPAPAPPSSADQGEASTNTTGPDRTTDAVTNRWSADHEWPTESPRGPKLPKSTRKSGKPPMAASRTQNRPTSGAVRTAVVVAGGGPRAGDRPGGLAGRSRTWPVRALLSC